MEGSASVHGHGDAERLGNFLFGAAGLEASIAVEGAAVVATRSDGPTDGDELHFFAKKGALEVRGGKGLIVLRESCQEFAELRYGFGEFGLLVLPVQHDAILHGCEMRVESIGLGRGCGKVCHFAYLIRGSWNSARRFRGQHTMW